MKMTKTTRKLRATKARDIDKGKAAIEAQFGLRERKREKGGRERSREKKKREKGVKRQKKTENGREGHKKRESETEKVGNGKEQTEKDIKR